MEDILEQQEEQKDLIEQLETLINKHSANDQALLQPLQVGLFLSQVLEMIVY